jgi:hypothetical protein
MHLLPGHEGKGNGVGPPHGYVRLRWTLTGLCIAVALSGLTYSLFLYFSYRNEYVVGSVTTPTMKRTDLAKLYLDLKQDQVKNIGQLVLLLTAGVWGLLIAKSDEAGIVLGDWPEIVMFLCFNAIVFSYFCFSYLYTNAMVYGLHVLAVNQEQLGEERVPDYYGTSIESLNQFTIWLLVAALVIAAMTFFSAHRLK